MTDSALDPEDDRAASAGIAPPDAAALSGFLEDHADAPGFELTHSADGEERTRLLHYASLHAVSLERPSAAPAIRCTPVAPGEDRFTVGVDAVEYLAVAEPPPELYTEDAHSPRAKATGLKRLADANPDAVSLPALLGLLDHPEPDALWVLDAFRALRDVAARRPADCAAAIPLVADLLDRDDSVPGTPAALGALRAVADETPEEVVHLADDLAPYLTADNTTARYEATRCVAAIAETDPSDAVGAVPALATVIEDRARGRAYAAYALSKLARAHPAEVRPFADALAEVLREDSLGDELRLNATSALGHVTDEYPDVATDVVDDLPALFDADNHMLRNNAVALLADVSTRHADRVEPHVEAVSPLLHAEDAYTRINASGVLSPVAEDHPDSVSHLTPEFVELLADDEVAVRTNAAWTLGHLAAEEATAALEECARTDDSEQVRNRAAWAVSEIDEH